MTARGAVNRYTSVNSISALNTEVLQGSTIIVYGAEWCEDTRRCLRLLRRLHVRCRYVNIDEDLDGLERALALTEGRRRTPAIDLGLGGAPLIEPSNELLTAALVEHQMLSGDEADERMALQNVGDVERMGRMAAGLAIAGAAGALPRPWRGALRVLGGSVAVTGFLGWCPAFHAAGVTSLGGPGDRPDEAERREWLRARASGTSVEGDAA